MKNSLSNKLKEKYWVISNSFKKQDVLHKTSKRNKKAIVASLLITSMVFMGYKQYEIGKRGLNVVYGEQNIGVVREEQEVIEIIEEIEKKLSQDLEKDIKIDKEISFEKTHVKDEELSKKEEIVEAIEKDLSYCAIAYAIKVDGKEVAYLETEEAAKNAIQEYKNIFIDQIDEETSEIKSVEVLEEVSLVKKEVSVSDIKDIESTIKVLKSGDIEEKTHIIEEDDNFWTIAQEYGITMESIEAANPEKDTKLLKPGVEVIVPVPKSLLTVVIDEEYKSEEETEFETEYEIDDELYKDEEKVKVEGEKGIVERTIQKERHNGVVIAEEVLSENILTEPVTKVIAKGVKERPAGKGTGEFITPTRGTVTSPFGPRWGRQHNGIDIGARVGEPIKASDAGTVKHSAFHSGGYGYMVEIDHGNGFSTIYAHCSKLYVKAGDKVEKGDVIAGVGNTGRSTGPHLHFEVRKDGTPQNPKNYI